MCIIYIELLLHLIPTTVGVLVMHWPGLVEAFVSTKLVCIG